MSAWPAFCTTRPVVRSTTVVECGSVKAVWNSVHMDRRYERSVIEFTQDIGSGQVRKITGAYAFTEDTLTICLPLPDRKLPKKIPDSPAAGFFQSLRAR